MSKKDFTDRFKDQANWRWHAKIRGLGILEERIQALIMTYQELYGVPIKDIQLYDPATGEIQFETDL